MKKINLSILITVDPEIPVPPIHYGGIERIIEGLCFSYLKLGQTVSLVARSNSTSKYVRELYGWPGKTSISKLDTIQNAQFLHQTVKKEKPDLIHSFSRLLYLYPVFAFTDIPVIQSYQRAISPQSTGLAKRIAGNKLSFTACGRHMVQQLPNPESWHAIHNFTDTEFFKPELQKTKDYLCFLGRLEDIKGVREAIEVARTSGHQLIIAGNIPNEHLTYFEVSVRPYLNERVQYIGPVDDLTKRELLQQAKALLFPIKWEEPFGIVMAEAMACGTPVIAFRRGSVPEVVVNGLNGYIVETVEEMAAAVGKLNKIDRNKVREYCVRHFSSEVIAQQYIDLYHSVLRK